MSINENLSKILDVEPIPVSQSKSLVPITENESKDHIESDYDLSRKTFKNLITKGEDALDLLMDIAGESQHPRAFEVAANLIKTVSDTTKELMELQKKTKEIRTTENKTEQSSINVEKAVFVGTPADLLRKIKEK
jgi:dTDP-D-glucose 4,6-dehydratase